MTCFWVLHVAILVFHHTVPATIWLGIRGSQYSLVEFYIFSCLFICDNGYQNELFTATAQWSFRKWSIMILWYLGMISWQFFLNFLLRLLSYDCICDFVSYFLRIWQKNCHFYRNLSISIQHKNATVWDMHDIIVCGCWPLEWKDFQHSHHFLWPMGGSISDHNEKV